MANGIIVNRPPTDEKIKEIAEGTTNSLIETGTWFLSNQNYDSEHDTWTLEGLVSNIKPGIYYGSWFNNTMKGPAGAYTPTSFFGFNYSSFTLAVPENLFGGTIPSLNNHNNQGQFTNVKSSLFFLRGRNEETDTNKNFMQCCLVLTPNMDDTFTQFSTSGTISLKEVSTSNSYVSFHDLSDFPGNDTTTSNSQIRWYLIKTKI